MKLALKKNDIVYEKIKRDILSGKLFPGQKMLQGVELAKQLKVSHITLRTAMKRLAAENLVTQIHGKGTYVTNNALRNGKTKNFLFLLPYANVNGFDSPFTYILPSCEKHCEELTIGTSSLCFEFINSIPQDHALSKLRENDYDGIIFMECNFKDNKMHIGNLLSKLEVPVILPHANETDKELFPQFATIHPDYKQAWIDGISHLKSLGHSRIAYVSSVYDNGVPNLRGFEYSEFLDFLSANGLYADPEFIIGTKFGSSTTAVRVAELMRMQSPPTAIMCFSDFFALDVYKALHSFDINIPAQVAVMGYCGYPGDDMLQPSLSTVDFEYRKIGRLAVKILNQAEEWFNKPAAVPHIISPHKIVSRESAAIRRN